MLRYVDGNGNEYVIDGERITYDPITPARSSSGRYSGGAPKTAAITREQYTAIAALFERILADTASHLTTRPLGSGTIVRDGTSVCFDSPLQRELERALKAALGG